jgi:tetratricopeptide (TPR) repeat protein
VDGDYAGAIPGLRAAAGLRPDAPQYAFFLGACQLLTNQVDPAVADFQRAIALGESPFLEEARFYLAKARLRQGNLPAARDELARTIERRGRLEEDARQLLAQVNALIAAKNP